MIAIICLNCGETFYRTQRNGSYGPKRYCSPSCRYKHMSGERHQNYTNGRYVPPNNDYITLLMPDHPRSSNGRVKEHIVIMEKLNGGSLPGGAEVHHKDGNRKNNDPSNLMLCSGRQEHMIIERKQKRIAEFGTLDVKRCISCKEVKHLDQYSKNWRSWDTKTNECKECACERTRAYQRKIS
jgi:hypothetical protein